MQKLIITLPFVEFPPTHTCDGPDTSPEIRIGGLDAESVAIFAINPCEPGCSFICWIMWNVDPVPRIPAGIPKKPVVTSPVRAVQGLNDYGENGWRGPCPPRGESHRISIKVYGLDQILDCPPGTGTHDLIRAMKGHVVQFGITEAIYHR